MAKDSTGQAASKKQIIMVAVALATLLGVVYFMFLRGGEEPASSAAPAPDAEATPAEEEPSDKNKKDEDKADAPKKKGKGPVETSEVFGGKDPFDPVIDLTPVVAAPESETPDATTDTTASTDDGTGTTPAAPTAPTTPTVPAPPTTPPPDDDDDDRTGWSVKLVLIYDEDGTKTALVKTVNLATNNKQQHEVQDGERFRKYFKVTSIENRCATFLFKHEWFALCEGQRAERN